MIWENLTSRQIAAVDRSTPVVLPMAAIEQHGPHLPLATDRLIIEHFCRVLDADLGRDVLILPTLSVGYSAHHMGFAGSLSLQHETFYRQAMDVLESALAHGFRNFVLFNGHGGNQAIGGVILEAFGGKHPECRVVFTSWWRLAGAELLDITETGPGGVGHACEFETSLVRVIAPELVDEEQVPERANTETPAWNGSDMLRGSRASLYRSLAEQTPTGVFGTPLAASLEKGHAITRVVVAALKPILADLRVMPSFFDHQH